MTRNEMKEFIQADAVLRYGVKGDELMRVSVMAYTHVTASSHRYDMSDLDYHYSDHAELRHAVDRAYQILGFERYMKAGR